MSAAKDLTKEQFDSMLATFKGVALIDFWAVWCGPCRIMEPVLDEQIIPNFPNVSFFKVNVDEQPELAGSFGVSSIPTFHLLHFKGDGSYDKLTHFIGVQDAFNMKLAIEKAIQDIPSDQSSESEQVTAAEGSAENQGQAL